MLGIWLDEARHDGLDKTCRGVGRFVNLGGLGLLQALAFADRVKLKTALRRRQILLVQGLLPT